MWTIDKSFIPFDARSKYSSKIATCLNHVSAIYIAVALVEGGASNSRLGYKCYNNRLEET